LAESSELIKNLLEVGTLYHSLLFSYQRALRLHMGPRADMYVHPAIEHLLNMDDEGGLKLDKSKTFEEAVSAFTDFLVRSKIVKNFILEKVDEDQYVFRVEGCIWAGKVHTRQVSFKDVTCPMHWWLWLCISSIRALFQMRMNQNTSPTELKQYWNHLHFRLIL
jgi:hypothetical protein